MGKIWSEKMENLVIESYSPIINSFYNQLYSYTTAYLPLFYTCKTFLFTVASWLAISSKTSCFTVNANN